MKYYLITISENSLNGNNTIGDIIKIINKEPQPLELKFFNCIETVGLTMQDFTVLDVNKNLNCSTFHKVHISQLKDPNISHNIKTYILKQIKQS